MVTTRVVVMEEVSYRLGARYMGNVIYIIDDELS